MTNRKLGRTSGHRKALFRNQLASLIESERIITTLIKAKELRPIAEKAVTLGKQGSLHARRTAGRQIASDQLLKKLFEDIAPRFAERQGGYTRIIKLGPRRGDGAEMAILEFVDFKLEAKQAPVTSKAEKKPKASAPAAEEKSEAGGEEKKPAKKKAAPKKKDEPAPKAEKKSAAKKPAKKKAE
ncbi:MAG: 50S ribosomal protein L17 [Acidobacteria bacterium]|nr:50S ribosomal protein L17 [Acidobacteriota bacterium]